MCKLKMPQISQIACVRDNLVMIDKNGGLWITIKGNPFVESITKQISTPYRWLQVSCGEFRALAIREDRTIWDIRSPVKGQFDTIRVEGDTSNSWARVSCGGYSHAVAIQSDGTLWGTGDNSIGQMGYLDGDTNILGFTRLSADNDWVQAACGYRHTVALKRDGTIWGVGDNGYGQLGGLGSRLNTITHICKGSRGVQVACGENHTVILKKDETLWGLGGINFDRVVDGVAASAHILTPLTPIRGWIHIEGGPYLTMVTHRCGVTQALGNTVHEIHEEVFNRVCPYPQGNVHRAFCGENFIALLDREGGVYTCRKPGGF